MLRINKGFTYAIKCNNCGESDPAKIEIYFRETFDGCCISAYCLSCDNDSDIKGENSVRTVYPGE